jgi:hypothetical protein
MRGLWLGLAALAVCLMAAGPVVAGPINLVTNGGFEAGPVFSSTPTVWTFTPASDGGSTAGVNFSGSGPHSGSNYYSFGAVGNAFDSISQAIPTTPGQVYTLSYFVSLDFSFGAPDEFQALWNGTVLSDLLPANGDSFGYTQFTFTVFGSAGATTDLTFQGINNPAWFNLDDVSVVVVPEPATFVLFGLGVAGLAVCARRRRARRLRRLPSNSPDQRPPSPRRWPFCFKGLSRAMGPGHWRDLS